MTSQIFQICYVVVIISNKFHKNSFDRGLNVTETALLLLENGSNFQNRNILTCRFKICKIVSVDESLKFQESLFLLQFLL